MNDAVVSSSSFEGPRDALDSTREAARIWRTTIASAIMPSRVISPGRRSGTERSRAGVLSLIEIFAVLQVWLRKGGAPVAVENQMTVLPQHAARLDAPRVVERGEDRCEKSGSPGKGRGRSCTCCGK